MVHSLPDRTLSRDLFQARPTTSLCMVRDALTQRGRHVGQLNSTTSTAPECILWLSILTFSAHPNSRSWLRSTIKATYLMFSYWMRMVGPFTITPAKWTLERLKTSSRDLLGS